jgi:hypothetical protein
MIKEKEFHSDRFQSPILSGQCGFDVTVSFTGSVTVKTFPNRPVGPENLTLEIDAIVFSTGNKTVRFRQVETTITQVKPNGMVTSTVAGKTVEFTGVQKINLENGETLLESHNVSEAAREAICNRLRG